MATGVSRFAEIMISSKVISLEQFQEADQVARESGKSTGDILVQLGYASGDEVMTGLAEEHRMPFVDLSQNKISESVV